MVLEFSELSRKKKLLREEMVQHRGQIDHLQRQLMDAEIAQNVIRLPHFERARVVSAYFAVQSEVDPAGILARALQLGKVVVAPRVHPKYHTMTMHCVQLHEEYEMGLWNIPQPRMDARLIAPHEIDVLIVPGVAFGKDGTRLGYGGGFYDRYLVKVRPDAVLIGLAYDLQVVDELPVESFDRSMTLVVTPTRIYE